MKQKSYFSTFNLFSLACIISIGASMGWKAGQVIYDLGVDLCEAGFKQVKKIATKAEEKKEEE